MSRKILALSAVVTLLVALFALTGATLASRTSSSVRASSPSAPTLFHRQMPVKQAGVKPDTSIGPCDGTETMMIVYNSGNSSICFHGTGYLANFGTLTNVTSVSVSLSAGWYRWYNSSGGNYCTLDNSLSGPHGESVSITQVNPGNTNIGLCG